jgi:hypothetical protein
MRDKFTGLQTACKATLKLAQSQDSFARSYLTSGQFDQHTRMAHGTVSQSRDSITTTSSRDSMNATEFDQRSLAGFASKRGNHNNQNHTNGYRNHGTLSRENDIDAWAQKANTKVCVFMYMYVFFVGFKCVNPSTICAQDCECLWFQM